MDLNLEFAAVLEAPALAALARRIVHLDLARFDSHELSAPAWELVHGQ